MPSRTIKYVLLADVARADINPKRHAAEAIAASLTRFGLIEPLLHDGRTGQIIAGHGRLEELTRRYLVAEPAPEGVKVDRQGRWKVPIVFGWSSSSDDEAHAAGVALNRIVEMGGWNVGALFAILDGLPAEGRLDGLGFTPEQLDDLLASQHAESYGGRTGGARADTSLGAKAEQYRTNGVRSLILDYPLAEYEQVQEALGKLRRTLDAETNAVVVQRLLEAT